MSRVKANGYVENPDMADLPRGLATPEQVERHRKWMEAMHRADAVATNHYRLLLGDAFFRRLHNTWSPLISPAPVFHPGGV